jgi:heptose I phosphotransferase
MISPEPTFQTQTCSQGAVHVRSDLRESFEQAGLRLFEDWMSLALQYREVSMRPLRPVVGIRVEGIAQEIFLKRNLSAPRPEGFFQKLGLTAIPSEGRKEAEKIAGFARAGIPTQEVLAWGEGNWQGVSQASFIATRDLEALPLERYLFHHWKRPLGGEGLRDKRATLVQLGNLARQMHSSGWVHRDFYLGHIFVRAQAPPENRLAVIDVQRATRRPTWWLRSRIKDLASLHFSADPAFIRPADRLRFLKAYWRTDSLSPIQRFLVGWILRKAERIRCHTEKSLGIPYRDFFKNKYY